jgi:BirA family biotin operon repressor/biotin-[acetyl-CoA-carboxylase] ligase
VSTNPGHYTDLVIGIGLNVNDTAHDEPLINKPWCSVFDITGQQYDRNILLSALIIQVKQHLQQLIKQGFSSFLPTWRPLDYLLNQYITVSQPLNLFSGKANGVNNEGYLILIDDTGVTHYLSSGDTSVNAAG